jgi:signal transduction histidine kinase
MFMNMKKHPFFFGPYTIFLFSVIGLGLVLCLFIYGYQQASLLGIDLSHVSNSNHIGSWTLVLEEKSWPILAILICTLALILLGIGILISYYHKTSQLYRLQENFLNNFTHELKTPIASIRLYLETFLRYELSREEQLEFVQYMLQDTQRLSHNVQQILQIGRLENKHQNYHFENCDIEHFIQEFLQSNRHIFMKGKIEVINQLNHRLFLSVNKGLFEILIMNLVSNAFKYSQGPVDLNIKIYAKSRRLLIDFTDNGLGIEKTDLKKIFQKFRQGKNDQKTSNKGGTGLGLYSAKQIVDIHRGKIWAQSQGPGFGSTFTLSFPEPKEYQ